MQRLFLSLVIGTILSFPLSADLIFNVSMDTASLTGSPAGPFSIAFDLVPGSAAFNNTASLSDFTFGAGTSTGQPELIGTASGDLSSSVQIGDTGAVNFFSQSFVPGDTLNFTLRLSTNTGTDGIPDQLVVYLLDNTDSPIPTLAGFGADYLLAINADATDPNVQSFAGDTSRSPVAGGNPLDFTPPSVSSIPEPRSLKLALMGFAIISIFRFRIRLRRQKS